MLCWPCLPPAGTFLTRIPCPAVNRLAERLQRIVASDFLTAQPEAQTEGENADQTRSTSTQDLLSGITTPNPLAELKSSRPQPNGYPSAADPHSTLQQVHHSNALEAELDCLTTFSSFAIELGNDHHRQCMPWAFMSQTDGRLCAFFSLCSYQQRGLWLRTHSQKKGWTPAVVLA